MPKSDNSRFDRLTQRAVLNRKVREFFESRHVMEVETPYLSQAAVTDPMIESFQCQAPAMVSGSTPRYLNTSPEFAMKRLLCEGASDIFQIARVFRANEFGRWHNPEFTLLEWYRHSLDYRQLAQECLALLQELAQHFQIVMSESIQSYADLFQQGVGINPHLTHSDELIRCLQTHGVSMQCDWEALDLDELLQLVLTHLIEPRLPENQLTVIYDFPASQAALAQLYPARIGDREVTLARRFEIYWGRLELANGFQELRDVSEQRARFEQDLRQR